MNYYDLVIIGAGPAGLSFAHCCSKLNKKILIIDKEETIGGCHRVKRINGLFTEHGPRIYLSNYVNFFNLLSEIGIDSNDIFVNYLQDISKIVYKFTLNELFILLKAYLKYLLNDDYGINIDLKTYCINNKVSEKGLDIINRLCLFMDGAASDKYSLNKFLKLVDTVTLVLQPIEPLDNLIFKPWQEYLNNNNVNFYLHQEVTNINYNKKINKIDYIVINEQKIYLDKLILAIPPVAITKILENNNNIKNCFGDFNKFQEWAEKTEYVEYISITYHFKENFNIPYINGLTFDTDWGLVSLNLSDYMKNIEPGYSKIFSVAITLCDNPSKYIKKTANQCSKEELYKEVYRQLKESLYPDLPNNYLAIINPNNYYKNNKWNNEDEAYFNTINTNYIPFQSNIIPNIYNLGTHNGQSYIEYTTLESAVSNGISLAKYLYPEVKYTIKKFWKISEILLIIIFILIIIIFTIVIKNILYN